jgi:2-C-methyl-D-erythritol 4-phosphate cytidylyltransferase
VSLFALIPASGASSRMRGGVPKQYRMLAGKPMLWHALRALDIAQIATVFVVLSKDDRAFGAQDWSAFKGRLEPLYCGGATRAESVHNGLIAAMAGIDADDWVLVHDAARPCLPHADLARLIAECEGDAIGGILALPVAETVKRVAKDEAGVARIAKSEDRSQLWLAQTPQMFRVGLLAQALHGAKGEVTDEASAIEQLGLQPRLVAGSRRNIKVTYAEDLAIAEAILQGANP